MHFIKQLQDEQHQYFVNSNGGIALPAAGSIYWLLLGVAGYWLKPGQWLLLSFASSGLLFPLGLALQKPLKANLLIKSPLSSLIGPALLTMMLSWPMTIAASGLNKTLAPLMLSIGMSLHWPIIGWLFNSRVCLVHALVRAGLTTTLWYCLPSHRFTLLPLSVAVVYGLTTYGLAWEVSTIQKRRMSNKITSREVVH